MILEEKLITLRKSKGLSQDDLANKLDVTRQAVYKWEAGQAIPDISKLKILSTLYNVSIDNLLNNEQDIVYMNAPKNFYGEVISKKVIDDQAAEKDNTKLLPDEAKKFKVRKLVLTIAKIAMAASLALALLFFVLCGIESDKKLAMEYSSISATFFYILIITLIAHTILNKVLYPKVQFARTYYNQEYQKATNELSNKYDTVTMLQPDMLAWFVYDSKTNSFGFYFDGEMQFFCPMTNYSSFVVTKDEVLITIDIKYFNQEGTYSNYKFYLNNFRQYWVDMCKNKDEMEYKQMQLNTQTTSILSGIKQRLDAEKSRI